MRSAIKARVEALNLPLDQIVVAGSGLLDALGMRRADDVDLVVSEEVFNSLASQGGWKSYTVGRDRAIGQSGIEAWKTWYGKSYDEVSEGATVIDGVRYMNHGQTIAWKRQLGRAKDINDIALLEEYYKHHG